MLTRRLTGRAPRADDAPGYRALLLAPEVGAWLRPPPLPAFTEGDVLELLERDRAHWRAHGFGPWAVLDRPTERYVGRVGLAWATVEGRRVVEIAWALVPDRWGEGLATEAARAAVDEARRLALEEVVAFTLAHNRASRRVMEGAGLRFAGEIEHAGLPHVLYRLGPDR